MVKPFVKQACIVSGVLLTMVEVGMCLGFTTCLLPALRDPDSDIKADLATSSWIAATFGLAWIPGFFTSSYYMDRFGRKIAFILDIIPGALGLILMYFSTNVYGLIAARALEGVTAGSTSILGAIVIGEYSSPVYRGMFLNLKTAALYMGSAIAHLLGNYFHWRTVALVTLIPYVVNFGIVWMWPESPSWLASKDRFEQSEKTFYWLRGKSEQSTKELREMTKAQQERTKHEEISFSNNVMIFFRKCRRRDFVMPVIIYFFAAVLLETSGRHIFPAYAVQIIAEVSGSEASFYYTLCLDLLVTVSAFFSSVLIRMFKRRTLLFTTGAAAFIVIMSVCLYLFLVSRSIIPNISWIPMGLFGMYLAIVNFACAPIPLALVGEIFPLEHRASGTTIAGLLIALTSIITLKTTPVMLATVKVYGTFTILGVIMAISLVFLYFMLPETKDRTLQEIEDYFNYGVYKADDRVEDKEAGSKMIEG
ncbi:facilitated trehalose transporter Tret1-like [Anticarsia gemmatalis]|uniref:facilitated trehalose transporter Tret1-like n=1 Tax=Anticarsia gemmatalis TaxID=129554 RepID=UPI003F76C1B0